MTRSIPKALRKKIQKQIPPVRCRANKTDGTPCPNWARVGCPVCDTHGAAAPQVRKAAAQRIALAEALIDFNQHEPRHPLEVLQDIGHAADVLYQHAKVANQGQPWTPQLLDMLKEAMSRAANLAKMNLEAGGDERRIALKERQAQHIQGLFVRIITGLDLTPAQHALLPALVQREIGPLMPKVIEAEVSIAA